MGQFWRDRLRRIRDRLASSPRFQRLAAAHPLTAQIGAAAGAGRARSLRGLRLFAGAARLRAAEAVGAAARIAAQPRARSRRRWSSRRTPPRGCSTPPPRSGSSTAAARSATASATSARRSSATRPRWRWSRISRCSTPISPIRWRCCGAPTRPSRGSPIIGPIPPPSAPSISRPRRSRPIAR